MLTPVKPGLSSCRSSSSAGSCWRRLVFVRYEDEDAEEMDWQISPAGGGSVNNIILLPLVVRGVRSAAYSKPRRHPTKSVVHHREHLSYQRVSFADALTDTESSDQSSAKDRDILSASTAPSRSILKTNGRDKSKRSKHQFSHVIFADRLTDSEESSGVTP